MVFHLFTHEKDRLVDVIHIQIYETIISKLKTIIFAVSYVSDEFY